MNTRDDSEHVTVNTSRNRVHLDTMTWLGVPTRRVVLRPPNRDVLYPFLKKKVVQNPP